MDIAETQRLAWEECVVAEWDPELALSFGEEVAHLHEEVSETLGAYRKYGDFALHQGPGGKPEGVGAELADVLIGLLYNARRFGVDLGTRVPVVPAAACSAGGFGEEVGRLHEVVSNIFRAYRRYHDFAPHVGPDGEPDGVDVKMTLAVAHLMAAAGCFGADLGEAFKAKHFWNLQRNYQDEGRCLHPTRSPRAAGLSR